jgi:uncharacterized protein DUF3179
VWETTVNGQLLHFHLAGINNQNFIMRDEETGSWWQQVTGEAIQGPLKGQQLLPVYHDELTFGLWKRERPEGRVLRPNEEVAQKGNYAPANWEERMQKVPVATSVAVDKSLEPRTQVIGVALNGAAKAYPLDAVLQQQLIIDEVGGVPIFIVVGDDKKSVRAYERTLDVSTLEFFVSANAVPLTLMDNKSGSLWDFTGKAISGAWSGRQLRRVSILNDYWFDWVTYHPQSSVYNLGNR